MDTKKLRQKILDLAIHGKLVPQDPNDEPASVLLERIKAEKERLIKEGKIKKSKKSTKASDTPHYEQVPFEVPGSWVWCTLGDLAFSEKYGMNREVVYPHSFRHRFAKNFLDRFNDIALLADLMGHESIETTRIYLRRTASEQQKIVDKIVNW